MPALEVSCLLSRFHAGLLLLYGWPLISVDSAASQTYRANKRGSDNSENESESGASFSSTVDRY